MAISLTLPAVGLRGGMDVRFCLPSPRRAGNLLPSRWVCHPLANMVVRTGRPAGILNQSPKSGAAAHRCRRWCGIKPHRHHGQPRVTDSLCTPGVTERKLLCVPPRGEALEHPLAHRHRGGVSSPPHPPLPRVRFRSSTGGGIQATLSAKRCCRQCRLSGAERCLTGGHGADAHPLAEDGKTPLFFAESGRRWFCGADVVKPDSAKCHCWLFAAWAAEWCC